MQALWGVNSDPLDDYMAEKVEVLRRLVVDYRMPSRKSVKISDSL